MILEGKVIEVVLDTTLEVKELKDYPTEKFNEAITDKGRVTVRDCISGKHRHKNYLNYLQMAWGSHYGVVISPDIFWHLALSEMGSHIKDNSAHYRSLFTTSDKKVDISVPTADPQLIDLNLIVGGLRKLVPTDVDLFLPEFTTTTPSSSLALMAVFADAMTPYYSYSMYMCGIPKIKILGFKSDWEIVINQLVKLKDVLNKDAAITKYFDGVIEVATKIAGNYDTVDEDFLRDIFSLERCGSGGQVEVLGWITKMFMKVPSIRYVGNYPTCISKVPYKFLDTNQDFELNYGLFSSDEEDGYLVPDFGFIINEVKE
jgi:hypothetical protein